MTDLLEWSASVVGPVKGIDQESRGAATRTHMVCGLRTDSGYCYLKTHRAPEFWHSEVHAYRRWTPVFGARAPELLGVRDIPPRAILVSALKGECQGDSRLPMPRQRTMWHTAGKALRNLHELETGGFEREGHEALRKMAEQL